MKALAALILAIVALSVSALAQGTIDFHNANTFPVKVVDLSDGSVTTLGAPGSPLGPASVRVGLFVGPNGATSISQMTMVGLTTNSASSVPLFVGTFNGGNPYTIIPSTPNALVSFAFAAWSISTGAMTYQEALTATFGGVGLSAIGNGYTLGGFGTPPSLPAATFGTPTVAQPWLINGFTISYRPVPEPSTMVLVIAGATAMWMLRRRT